jgi:MFS family permease
MAWSAPVLQLHGNYRLCFTGEGNADWLWIRNGLAMRWRGCALLARPVVTHRFPHKCADRGGLTLVGVGTFFAQAAATGFVGRVAMTNRGAASGLYLASYFSGGLVGSAVLGQIFDSFGWPACVLGIGLALAISMVFATQMTSEAAIAGCLRRSQPTTPDP